MNEKKFDRTENEYLKRVLSDLVKNIREDVPNHIGTRHLWDAVEEAEEALGLHDLEA